MRRTLIAASCMLVLALAGRANAEMYVPAGLQAGDQYRLIFVTSGSITGSSADPAVYDSFLATQVANTMLGGYDYGWQAVLSTAGGGRVAKNIINDPAGVNNFVGIYNSVGLKVADNGADMLDGTLDSAVQYDQHGTSVATGYVWTGSLSNGEAANNYEVGSAQYVGAPAATIIGAAAATDTSWIQVGALQRNVTYFSPNLELPFRVYGMSDVLTVVPEPATFVMWSLFAGVAGLVFWRKGRKTS
ncbi:MAG: PEP-CTERM sorting domain-containing protein [Pirellulaceae bacterium]